MKKRIFIGLSLRRCCKAAFPRSRQSGFTIVELMMSLVLLAIGAALSLPSYREMMEKRQLTHGAEQIMAFVNSAQSEAIKQNQIVTVSYVRAGDANWCVGAITGAAACDCRETVVTEADYCAIESAARILNNSHVGNTNLVKSMTGDGAYSFDPIRGIFLPNLDDSVDSLVVAMSSNSAGYKLDLRVSNTGQAILCSNDADHSVPGYKVCP
jgi:prepilin-type N-terminal cleavage/methylation domain-containing protein